MKVVLFCGGMGMRMREYSEAIPKPMVPVGYRPILWHVMKYYAAHGHNDFILCLGWKADVIKEYFRTYDETVSNDFVMQPGGGIELLASDTDDWRITFVDTGVSANVGERLAAVRHLVKDEPYFLANYADGLSDLPLDEVIEEAKRSENVATFLGVSPSQSFHIVSAGDSGQVNAIGPASESGLRINGGFFVLRQDIFDYMQPGEELVDQPFQRLIERNLLGSHLYDGFWACMDTFKEKELLDDLYASGNAPWSRYATNAAGRVAATHTAGPAATVRGESVSGNRRRSTTPTPTPTPTMTPTMTKVSTSTSTAGPTPMSRTARKPARAEDRGAIARGARKSVVPVRKPSRRS